VTACSSHSAPIIGKSPAIHRARDLISRYATTRLPILVMGETGTGKELVAQHIHSLSGRPGPLVDVNCGALPRDMVESLLFGHRRGSFTGAVESVPGYVERANGRTLFLDEVSHLPVDGQVKLLRVLETREVERLGEGLKRQVDFRVVSAVQDDLAQRLKTQTFRRDLFQRLAGVVILLPPLRDRMDDVELLARHFAQLEGRTLDDGCRRVLTNHGWPGNVRELRLAIERAGQLVENGTVPPSALAESIQLGLPEESEGSTSGRPAWVLGVPTARQRMLQVCAEHDWDYRLIATALRVGKSTLYRRLARLGISLRAGGLSH
jgi:transcriptional regulator with PAS, ATPase and Fis domain